MAWLVFALVAFVSTVGINGQSFENVPFSVHPRIVGGSEVVDRCQPPFDSMVALHFQDPRTETLTYCSAVMLSADILVTAATCLNGANPQYVVVGERDLMGRDSNEQIIRIDSVKIHESYNATTDDNNIGLIRLAQPAVFSDCVKPAIRLETDPNACTDFDSDCLTAGWGPYTETDTSVNSRLPRYAPITLFGDFVSNIISQTRIQRVPPSGSLLAEAQQANVKACFYDWGSVVACLRNNRYVLRGVVSQHNCNTNSNAPIVVTHLDYFQSWLENCERNWDRCKAL